MATVAEYAGEHCKSIGLTIDQFYVSSAKAPGKEVSRKGMLTEELWIMAEWATDRYCSRENEFYYCEAQGFKMSAGFPQNRSGSIWSKRIIFYEQEQKEAKCIDEVVCNLLSLISPSRMSTPTSPFVAIQESLIGRCVCHKWREQDGSQHCSMVLWKYNYNYSTRNYTDYIIMMAKIQYSR